MDFGMWPVKAMKPLAAGLLGIGLLSTAHAAQQGRPAPAFPALERHQGKVVLVDFWASWCAPCREALPQFDALQRDLGTRGFTVIGVDVDQHPVDGKRVLQDLHLSYPQVQDSQGRIATRYDLPAMPMSYLVDRHGIVRRIYRGFRKSEIAPLREEVKNLLGEK